jgi:hypothetical protein
MKWLRKLQLEQVFQFIRNVFHVPVDMLKNLISSTKLKHTLVKWLGWGLLYMGKPFTAVGNYIWKLHRKVLDWNK